MEDILNCYDYYINKLIKERDEIVSYIYHILEKHNYNNLPSIYTHKLKIKFSQTKNNNNYLMDKEVIKTMIKNALKITLQDFNYIQMLFKFNVLNIDIQKDYITFDFEIFKPIIQHNNIYIFDQMIDTYKINNINAYIEMFNYAVPELKLISSFIFKEMKVLDN